MLAVMSAIAVPLGGCSNTPSFGNLFAGPDPSSLPVQKLQLELDSKAKYARAAGAQGEARERPARREASPGGWRREGGEANGAAAPRGFRDDRERGSFREDRERRPAGGEDRPPREDRPARSREYEERRPRDNFPPRDRDTSRDKPRW
jgi:hypothetical protein